MKTNTNIAAANTSILAIDLGKYKSVAGATRVPGPVADGDAADDERAAMPQTA
jgi:hypothetical protein